MAATEDRNSDFQLPYLATRLIGREQDVEAVGDLLLAKNAQLVTLTGPGGVGKTRLALSVAERLQREYRDGAVYLQFAGLRASQDVIPSVARALEVRERVEQPVHQGLQSALREQERLLLLDNLEHLTDAASDLAELLSTCPKIRLLVTSRVPLRIRAEHVFPVQPLRALNVQESSDPETIAAEPAVALFLDRARAVDPGFRVTDQNARDILRICTRLDGLPLAIELAATRIRLLSPTQLLAGLDQRLSGLPGGPRDLPERQRTLENTIEWSYDLLTPEQQAVFRRLSVFHGPWTLEGAKEVAGMSHSDVLGTIDGLVEHNLVVRSGELDGVPSFSMLQTVREFALNRLSAHDEEQLARARHVDWFLSFGKESHAGVGLLPSRQIRLMLPDFQAAISWLVAQDNPDDPRLSLLAKMWPTILYFPIDEGKTMIGHLLQRTAGAPDLSRAGVLANAAWLANVEGNAVQAAAYIDESIAIARSFDPSYELVHALTRKGQFAQERGAPAEAMRYLTEAHSIAEFLDDHYMVGFTSMFMALSAYGLGETQRAVSLAEQSVSASTRENQASPMLIAHCLSVFALVLAESGRYAESAERFAEAVQTDESDWLLALCCSGLASLAQDLACPSDSAKLVGFVNTLCTRLNARLLSPEFELHRYATNSARESLGEERFQRLETAGRQLSIDQGAAFALETANRLRARADTTTPPGLASDAPLTPRELDVLHLIADGYRNREIAEKLFISPKTVDNHVTNIYGKLGITSRLAAVRYAIEHGIATDSE